MSKTLFYETQAGEQKPVKRVNPLIKVYGEGPEGKKCADCIHQFFRSFSKKYSKCDLRKVSSGPATDHSSRFPACGKFEQKETSAKVK